MVLCAYTLSLSLSLSRFGGSASNYPQPDIEWAPFERALANEIKQAGTVWSPLRNCERPWIDIHKVKAMRPGGCTCNIS